MLELGDRAVVLSHPGRAHTHHDLTVWVADAAVLFAVAGLCRAVPACGAGAREAVLAPPYPEQTTRTALTRARAVDQANPARRSPGR